MKALVTGAAGFIGSHLSDDLLSRGHDVIGLDNLTDYYDPAIKRRNVAQALPSDRYEFTEADLVTADLRALLGGVDVIFHQAGQPGVRLSWADSFGDYVQRNVLATQRLLEAASAVGGIRFVYASSSSIYGSVSGPMREDDLPRPYSPYGVTKLAGEHLCGLYSQNKGIHSVALRYFTVYGPRQRPDMAANNFIERALAGRPITLFGTGQQIRDFTYVSDIVAANLLVADADLEPGQVFNVSGGSSATVLQLIDLIGDHVGAPLVVERHPQAAGDVPLTAASSARLRDAVGWSPKVSLDEGVGRQVAWHRDERALRDAAGSA